MSHNFEAMPNVIYRISKQIDLLLIVIVTNLQQDIEYSTQQHKREKTKNRMRTPVMMISLFLEAIEH